MNRDFFGAREIAGAVRRVRFGAQKSLHALVLQKIITSNHV